MSVGIDARGLALGHGGEPVASGIDLAPAPGAVTALVGPNGSGKSTLLRALARLHAPDAGRIVLDGRDLAEYRPRELARKLSFLTQSPVVPAGVTVEELVAYGRHPHRGLLGGGGDGDREAVSWALDATGLRPLAGRTLDRLSGGERQRAWIAMALAQRTGLLLLDEPTTYLDLRYQIEVLRLVRRLADGHGITVVVVLHDLNQAAAFSDAVVVLAGGRIVASGTPARALTEDTVRAAFRIDATVTLDPRTGVPTCLPRWREPSPAAPAAG
ncbi:MULTISPECIES: ABC transporter ATP-binding protein [Streptomyces]|uniref:ABC transporter ATP-binding protein n=1 Tax=Streptomyces sudanensis TaxID=436397 RepID=A0ABY4TL16_9ACTN|nr:MULTISPECIES: ABC transporter ATP-binding protein [Streptomyces]URN17462.1 ABC transporter ATP-binding protein [Streptomyces sudanensis]